MNELQPKAPQTRRKPLFFGLADFFRAEGLMILFAVIFFLLLYRPLLSLGSLTNGLVAALFLLCWALSHWAGGVLVVNKRVRLAVNLLVEHRPDLAEEKVPLLQESVAYKGCFAAHKLRTALEKRAILPGQDEFAQALGQDLLLLEKLWMWLWMILPFCLLLPAVMFANL